ncbi:unnamed protein product [Rhizophagus irregularis]|nr:unnamed protein product [Rhizophagus irregularis]
MAKSANKRSKNESSYNQNSCKESEKFKEIYCAGNIQLLNINGKIKVLPILRELNVSGCDSFEEIDCAENDGINLANILNCKIL